MKQPGTIQEILGAERGPATPKMPYSILRSSNADIVSSIEDMDSRWLEADRSSRERLFECLGAMLDVNAGSWPKAERDELIAKGRHPVSFNIAEQKLNSLAGSIRAEKWDFDFLPLDGNKTSLTEGIKYWYYADKDNGNYEWSENKALIRGLIHSAYEIMEISYEVRPTGAITFRPALPGTVIEDPNWISDDQHDWRRAILHGWMTASEMVDYFESDSPELHHMALLDRDGGESYDSTDAYESYLDSPAQKGSRYKVIEYRELIRVKTTRLYARLSIDKIVPFPVNAKEDEVRRLMEFYGVQSSEDVFELPYIDDVMQYAIVSPSCDRRLILAQGKHPIQCGSIGIYPFSASREMGVKKGVMQAALDVQRTLNYRESKKDDIIASAASGATAVNVDALPNGDRDLANIQRNKTRPDFVFGVNGDPSKVMAVMPHAEVPASILQDIGELVAMFDRVLPVTPALEGRAQEGESGIAFEMRHAVTKLGTLILYDNWQQHQRNKAEGWYNQAQIQYKNVYREIKNTETDKTIEFNSPRPVIGADGSVEMGALNAIEELPRAQVVVSLKKSSPTERYAKRMELWDITKILAGHGELFSEEARIFIYDMLETFDRPAAEKTKMERIKTMKETRDLMNLMKQLEDIKAGDLNAKVLQAQAKQVLAQLMAQTQQTQNPQQPQGAPEAVSGPKPPEPGPGQPGSPPPNSTPSSGGGKGTNGPSKTPLAPRTATSSPATPGEPIMTSRGVFAP